MIIHYYKYAPKLLLMWRHVVKGFCNPVPRYIPEAMWKLKPLAVSKSRICIGCDVTL